ncbi:Pectate trisaccharide-lyase [Diplonema papillatum]|nr:Pectate trisaccharide-lyase [Diplonema papillatum]
MGRAFAAAARLLVLAAAATADGGFASQNGGTTGGAGGEVAYASTGKEIHEALCSRASRTAPITIYVEGTINHSNTKRVSGGGCSTDDEQIELNGVANVSLIGYGTGALFDQVGIHIEGSSNIVLQNLHVRNVKKSGSPLSNGGDAIGIESRVSNVVVDHCTLEASGGEDDGFDGLFDMKAGSRHVTLSYSILRNSGRGGLVGSSDSDTENGPVTFHHNYYRNLDSRAPLLRAATAHSYNNYFQAIHGSAINSRLGAAVLVENNYFHAVNNPLGTFYTDRTGYWQVGGNEFEACTWTSDDHPAGPDPKSTTNVSIPYAYALDPASCVPSVVLATAGAGSGLKVSDGACGVGTSSPSLSIPPTTSSPTWAPGTAVPANSVPATPVPVDVVPMEGSVARSPAGLYCAALIAPLFFFA